MTKYECFNQFQYIFNPALETTQTILGTQQAWSDLAPVTQSKNDMQTVNSSQRHLGKPSPFFRLNQQQDHCRRYRMHKGEKHSGMFWNCLGWPREFYHSLFEKWSEPLRHKIDFEWENGVELKIKYLKAALGWELIERENIFIIKQTQIGEINLTWLLWWREHKLQCRMPCTF